MAFTVTTQEKEAIKDRMSKMSDSDKESFIYKMIKLGEAAEKGENVLNPGVDVGMTSSASLKAFGVDALNPGDGRASAAWLRWDDPSRGMNPAVRASMLSKSLREVGYQEKRPWESFGDFLKDGFLNSKDNDFVKKHKSSYEKVDRAFFKARGLTTISGENGGFLVNPEIAPTVEWLFNTSDLPGRINTLPIQSMYYEWPRAKDLDRNNGSRHGGVFHYWIDEGADGTESKPSFVKESMKMKKLAIFVPVTHELMNNSPYAVEQQIRDAVRAEINFALAHSIVWGNGIADPLGFATSAGNSTALISVAKESGQSVSTFNTTNALKMLSRLYRTSQSQAIWLHHQSVISQFGLLNIQNYPVSVNLQNGGIQNEVIQTLLGKPLIESELCNPLGDAGDVFLIDPKAYVAITQSTVRDDVSIHVDFMSDQSMMRFIIYFDGRPLYTKPVTPFKGPNATLTPDTQSSFVQLAARTS